jgi:hypothetical protein
MRLPTAKEKFVMGNCLDGLRQDIEAIKEATRPDHDVLGTMRVNLEVLTRILKKMEDGTVPDLPGEGRGDLRVSLAVS